MLLNDKYTYQTHFFNSMNIESTSAPSSPSLLVCLLEVYVPGPGPGPPPFEFVLALSFLARSLDQDPLDLGIHIGIEVVAL
jgi:hypothetical protein